MTDDQVLCDCDDQTNATSQRLARVSTFDGGASWHLDVTRQSSGPIVVQGHHVSVYGCMLDKHAFAEAGSDVNAALHEVAAEIGAIELAEAAFALLPAVSL